MKRTKLAQRKLPDYTKGEEIMNMITHIVGGGLGVIALVACILRAVLNGDRWALITGIVYGCSMILLYTMS